MRQSLGAVLLAAGRGADEAEAVYREDLRAQPGERLVALGLAQSLRAQGDDREAAAAVERRFQTAWARADVTLAASRF